jgi:hypothetical protein
LAQAKTTAAELAKTLRMMDVADEIRRTRQRIEEHLADNDRETIRKQLLDRYRAMGHEADPNLLDAAIDTVLAQQNRFRPAVPGLGTRLATLYVRRAYWRRTLGVLLLILTVLVAGGLAVRSGVRSAREGRATRAEQRVEKRVASAASMLERLREIAQEPKAVALAENHHADALQAAAAGDRQRLGAATDSLRDLLDQLEQAYTMIIVRGRERENVRHYLIVQAVTESGQAVRVKIRNEESGAVDEVSEWGERVTREVYDSVSRDYADDRVIEDNVFGHKRRGFMEPERLFASTGQITRW